MFALSNVRVSPVKGYKYVPLTPIGNGTHFLAIVHLDTGSQVLVAIRDCDFCRTSHYHDR